MRASALKSLIPLSIIGLAGILLLRKDRTSPESKFNYFDKTDFKDLKRFIIAQSKVESANYSSDLYKRSFNAFGMKNAKTRSQLGYPIAGDPYRHYSNLLESIQDFEYYLKDVNFPKRVSNTREYAESLKRRNYFESELDDYINALNSWI